MKNSHRILTRLRQQMAEDNPPMLSRAEIKTIAKACDSLPDPPPLPTRREQFLLMVFSGALMRDVNTDTNDAQVVARAAMAVNPNKIPPNIHAAAASFLNYFYTNKGTPHKWMVFGAEKAIATDS